MKTLTPLRAAPFFCKSLLSLDAKMEEPIVAAVEGQKTSKVFSF